MFCNSCGTALEPSFVVCPKCGRPAGDRLSVPRPSRLESHLRTLGTLWIVAGALFLIPSAGMFFLGSFARFVVHGNPFAQTLGPIFLSILGGTIMLVGLGGILVGWGLRNREPWARTVAIVLGILALFHPLLGTALGVYTLWVLLSENAEAEYGNLARN